MDLNYLEFEQPIVELDEKISELQNVSEGGAYIGSINCGKVSPGQEIFLVPLIRTLCEEVCGKISWVGSNGMGVEFQLPELEPGEWAPVPDDTLASEKDSKNMGKVNNKKVRWEPSTTPDVKYRLYWSIDGGVDYHSDHVDVGNVTEVNFPNDIPSFPLTSGKVELGISAISEAGNESELTKTIIQMDFTVPEAPKNLLVEDG